MDVIKISQLPPAPVDLSKVEGLVTIGVDGNNESVQVPIGQYIAALLAQFAELMKVAPIARMSQSEYDALEERNESRLYFITDSDGRLYRMYAGSLLFAESANGITFPFTFPFTFSN